ncbi:hypothetical protein C2845_PM05G16240 [Panicum miliaceum]|uniref:Uncharacterized protein n=1 Tax=Panicum miliaceum TaxID=4540 RepID=A0A3L6SZV1_PANMI|nr:hypothetical protein C2845_PM05G16240 [Panicum miliaceum]
MLRPRCRLLVLCSCPEAEPRLFPHLTDMFARPVVPAGLLLPSDDAVDDDDDHDQSFSAAIRWLDEQPRGSVIYVALGSEAPVTADNVRELALGLELSGARFLWALRRPAGGQPLLPDGFEARVAGRGVVSAGWVPQVRVLAHTAVAAFLTHCGWGSTLESLFRFGLPLLMLPLVVDQGLIARAVAARGAGVEVPRNGEDGSFRGGGGAAGDGRRRGPGAGTQGQRSAEGCR